MTDFCQTDCSFFEIALLVIPFCSLCLRIHVVFLFRYLEEGNLEMAHSEKQRIEDMQRARRKWNDENNIKHEPRFFK